MTVHRTGNTSNSVLQKGLFSSLMKRETHIYNNTFTYNDIFITVFIMILSVMTLLLIKLAEI